MEAEKMLLANMLVFNRTIPEVLLSIIEDDFENPKYREAFVRICAQYEKDGAVDQTTVMGIEAYLLAELTEIASVAMMTKRYAKKVLEASLMRKSLEFSRDIVVMSSEGKEDIKGFMTYLSDRVSGLTSKESENLEFKISRMQESAIAEAHENAQRDTIGLKTGIRDLDKTTGGVQRGHLWVVGAYTSVGKTAFAIQCMVNMLRDSKRCVMLSNEMTAIQITFRIMAILTGIPAIKIQHGRYLNEEEKEIIARSYELFSTFQLTVVENMSNLTAVLSMLKKHRDADIVFVDYLGQISSEERSEYEQMTRISRDIQATAMQCRVPVIALSQVSNESAKNASQVLGFKGSGNIAAASDVGIELYRNKEESPEVLTLKLRKNRHGATGDIDLHFDVKSGRIT